MLAVDLKTIYQRIKDNVDVLCNFSAKREEGKERAEYISLLKKDLCTYYSYNYFLIEKLLDLFPLSEVGERFLFFHIWNHINNNPGIFFSKLQKLNQMFPLRLLAACWFPWGQRNSSARHHPHQHPEDSKTRSCTGDCWEGLFWAFPGSQLHGWISFLSLCEKYLKW